VDGDGAGPGGMDSWLVAMDWVLPLRRDWATPIALGFTWLGYTPFFLMFLPLGYWLWDRAVFTRLAVLVTLTAVLNGWLKDFWQDPRPGTAIALDGRVSGSPGRPSGHTQVAVAMWLWLAYEVGRPWVWALCLVLAAGVSFSRLYLGVHDVDDVLIGAALALATLAVFAWMTRPHTTTARALRGAPVAQLMIVLALVPVVWALWPTAVVAADRAVHAGPAPTLTVMFLLAGWLAGMAMDMRLAPVRAGSARWWQRCLIAILGVTVLFMLRWAIERTGAAMGVPDPVTGFVGAAILGFYMTGLAPLGLRAVRLMR